MKPPELQSIDVPRKRVRLSWTGNGRAFEGNAGGRSVLLDGDGVVGPSPTEMLLLSLAACMGIDVQMILEKSRVALRSLDLTVDGERSPDHPRRFTRLGLVFRLDGPTPEDGPKIERAIRLSQDKYCSVLHTLRSDDLPIDVRFELA